VGVIKLIKKAATTGQQVGGAVASRNTKCDVCTKTIVGGARKGSNVCSKACAQFWAENM
jgi:hypothetical protein